MSKAEELIRHQGDAGWVVLASQVPRLGGATPELADHLVARMDLSRLPVCLVSPPAPDDLNLLLEEIETLLGVTPAVQDANLEPPAELAKVALLILAGDTTNRWVERLQDTLLGEVVLQALGGGAIIVAIGSVAGAVGSWYLADDGETVAPALGWLGAALVVPGQDAPAELASVRQHLTANPKAYALGLSEYTLVALGPEGEIEVWGASKPTIILGQGWRES